MHGSEQSPNLSREATTESLSKGSADAWLGLLMESLHQGVWSHSATGEGEKGEDGPVCKLGIFRGSGFT